MSKDFLNSKNETCERCEVNDPSVTIYNKEAACRNCKERNGGKFYLNCSLGISVTTTHSDRTESHSHRRGYTHDCNDEKK
jgi:hypothetical protein